MPSLQSRLFYLMLRYRHLMQFRLKRDTWDWNTSITAFREECERGAARFGKLPARIVTSPVVIAGLPAGLAAEWVLPSSIADPAQAEGVIFYTHGGGYVSGSCSDHRNVVAKFVERTGFPLLQFEYRLAPEHPYPAALDDTLVAYRWLLAQGVAPSQIVIAGESAGGGLCLATLLALRDQAMPLPAAAVALSPWTDLTLSGESHRTRAKQAIDTPGMSTVCCKYYAGDSDPTLPYMSPLFGDLVGLPPLRIYVGDYEMLRDDSIRFADKAKAAGVDVTLTVGEEMVHCYPLLAGLFPEATAAMDEIGAFIKSQVNEGQGRTPSSTPERVEQPIPA